MTTQKKNRSPARLREFLRRFWQKYQTPLVVSSLVFLFFVVYFWKDIFIFIEPGQAGVRWNRFTGTEEDTYFEGINIIPPWDKMYIYDVRIQERKDTLELLSSDGLPIDLRISVRFQPNVLQLSFLHKEIGEKYADKIVMPEAIEALRKVIGNYRAQDIFATDEHGLLQEIKDALLEDFRMFDQIMVDKVLIEELSLPEDIQHAIVAKLQEEQREMQYKFRVRKESAEKDRKFIEAEGIKRFEEISGISIIQWRALEVTEKLAESPNSKIIVIGTDDNDLPVLLNAGEAPSTTSNR